MAYITYNKLWENEFDNIVSKKDKLQEMNKNHLRLELHDTYNKMKILQQILGLLINQML